ncbi:hypothetical protein L873DRAFT_1829936 [Choiromyces venosus 120613-1]|uniref:Uncharacterized protein n=1 Tax=Choiromyces venosus 120613-1 TaxID=1336337 RepID=A0A3N4JDC4_9PEZI|nr:hypothetical protein L873DRAFT_1829936 [Choiromyces venosus 120613-1]
MRWAFHSQTLLQRAVPHNKDILLECRLYVLALPITDVNISASNSNIQGNFCGNTGDHNNFNCGDPNPTGNHAEILQYLYTSQYELHRGRVPKPVEGTCTWLSADPGCGKSVTASFLITYLEKQRSAIRRATFALCTILHQLFSQRESLCRYAEEVFTEEVDTLWDILVKVVAEGRCDECEERTLDPLIHHITHVRGLQNCHIPLKFLMRLGSPETTIQLKGEDEVDALTADSIKKLESYWGPSGGLGYLRDLLVSSADRTFLWVSLFIDIVTTAPRDLAELYTQILDKSTKPDRAQRILNIVVVAASPLTLQEMNVAFKIKREHNSITGLGDLPEEFERTVKYLCGLFVRVIDSKIYLIHQTTREFLIKGSLPGHRNWQYILCPRDSNFIMTDICISYLLLEEFASDPLVLADTDNLKDQQMELFEFTLLICEAGSRRFLTWLQVYWFHVAHFSKCPKDWTHLMLASWLGQGTVVARLLEEGGDIHARAEIYGTAVNLAAIQKNKDITRMLLQSNVKADLYGNEYNILHVKRPLGLTRLVHN